MATYLNKVRKDIVRWRDAGLIDAATAENLLVDVAGRGGRRRFSFGLVLAILAAMLVAAALLLLIASNWEAFPRPLRVAMVFIVILGGYAGGAVLMKRGQGAFAEALWLVAAAAFGGGIALVGQMYHLSGDEADALLIWGAGTALAAAALRSAPLTVGAVLLAAAWMVAAFGAGWPAGNLAGAYVAYAVLLWLVTWWTASVVARHLILLSFMLLAALAYIEHEIIWSSIVLAAVSACLIGLHALRPPLGHRLFGLGDGLPVQGLVGFIAGLSIIQAELYDGPYFLLIAIVVFAGVVAALLIAGRDNRALRWVAYAGFIFELGFVYVTLLESMLDTSGFFLAAGLTLALLAWLIGRVEKRIGVANNQGEASA